MLFGVIFLKKSVLIFICVLLLAEISGCVADKEAIVNKSEFDMLFETLKYVGFDEVTVEETDRENSYRIFMTAEEFDEYVEAAGSVCESYGNEGYEMLLILAKERMSAKLFDMLSRRYEWTPCDPAEKIVFAKCGGVVVAVKGKKESTEKVYNSFCGFFGKSSCEKREKERIADHIE